jgi:hypothetical protein
VSTDTNKNAVAAEFIFENIKVAATATSNLCGPSVWDLLHVTLLVPRLLFKWPHIFGKFLHPYINGTAWRYNVDRFNSNDFIVTAMYANNNNNNNNNKAKFIVHAKVCGGTEVQRLSFITWVINGVEW